MRGRVCVVDAKVEDNLLVLIVVVGVLVGGEGTRGTTRGTTVVHEPPRCWGEGVLTASATSIKTPTKTPTTLSVSTPRSGGLTQCVIISIDLSVTLSGSLKWFL